MTSLKSFLRFLSFAIAAFAIFGWWSAPAAEFPFANFPEFGKEVAYGFGIDPAAADPGKLKMGKAIDFQQKAIPSQPGGLAFDWEEIRKSEEAISMRSFGATLQARYKMYRAEASFESTVASRKKSDSIIWQVRLYKNYGVREELTDIKLQPVAETLVKEKNYQEFIKRYGTHFISRASRAATVTVRFESSNLSEEDERSVRAALGFSAKFVAGDASAKAVYQENFRKLSQNARTSVSMIVEGIEATPYFKDDFARSVDEVYAKAQDLFRTVEQGSGNPETYYTRPYYEVIEGFPRVPPPPPYLELDKAQVAYEVAYSKILQIDRFMEEQKNLDRNELSYLQTKRNEVVNRRDEIARWARAFESDKTLKARAWPTIDLQLPEVTWYAGQPVFARDTIVIPIFVSGGSEVGAIHWRKDKTNLDGRDNEPVWPSRNALQLLDTQQKLDYAREQNGSLRRWFLAIDSWTGDPNRFNSTKGDYWAELLDKDGRPITYAKDRYGRYVVPTARIGLSVDPWPGPNGDLTHEALGLGPGNDLRINRPINGAAFTAGETIELEAQTGGRGTPAIPQVEFWLDNAKLPGSPVVSGVRYHYLLKDVAPGLHQLTIRPIGTSGIGVTLAPVTFSVRERLVVPTITMQPQSMTANPGSRATLSVAGIGTAPLGYRWQFNGVELFDNSRISGSATSVFTITSVTSSDVGSYTVVVSNTADSVTSIPAVVTLIPVDGPFHPADKDKDWTLNLGEVLAYASNFKRGADWTAGPNPIPLGYVIRGFTLYKTGERYKNDASVGAAPASWVSDTAKTQSLAPSNQQPVRKATVGKLSAAGGTAMRQLEPSQYTPGTAFKVSVIVTPASGGFAYGVEEQPPAGWAVSGINESGAFDAVKNKVKWTFLDNNPRALTYQAIPPANASGTVTFTGTANFDGVKEITIAGSSQISPVTQPPTITPPPVQPPPVTPPATVTGPAVRKLPAHYTPGVGVSVSIVVTPASGGFAYGVEEQPPAAWTISGINDSGAFDAAKNKVKWTFLDNNPRTLTYQATPPAGATGTATFAGTANFDGVKEMAITGQAQISLDPGASTGGGTQPPVQTTGPAVRQRPAQYTPGVTVTVTIVVTPASGGFAYGVEEQPPSGWPVSAINESGAFDASKGKVKWTFLDNNSRTLTYQVTPPANATGTPAFSGTVNFDGVREVAILDTTPILPPPPPPGDSFVKRKLPAGYAPGAKFTVTLQADPANNITVYAVEDHPPASWTVGTVSESGLYDPINQKVKWGPFFDHNSRTLTYDVTPPAGQTGPKQFTGTSSADGVNLAVGGAGNIDVVKSHPADNNPADGRMIIEEITAYGLAWKKGQTWSIGPNPIPIDYLTQAGLLWKNGELYTLDPSIPTAPKWWVNVRAGTMSAAQRSQSILLAAVNGSASRAMPSVFVPGESFEVRISVKPMSGTSVYALQDGVPAGWTVRSISQEGTFDDVNRAVKWGPFFDSTPRELNYEVAPSVQAAGTVAFVGAASFDGGNVSISGQRESKATSRLAGLKQLPNGELQLKVSGRAGAKFDIEASSDLLNWTPMSTVVNSDGTVAFRDPGAVGKALRFFRAVNR